MTLYLRFTHHLSLERSTIGTVYISLWYEPTTPTQECFCIKIYPKITIFLPRGCYWIIFWRLMWFSLHCKGPGASLLGHVKIYLSIWIWGAEFSNLWSHRNKIQHYSFCFFMFLRGKMRFHTIKWVFLNKYLWLHAG